MFVRSRWFPWSLALLQTAVYVGLVVHGYWIVPRTESRFDVREFVRRDFARLLFEPSGFCGAWSHYTGGQSALLGLDLPAYLVGTLLHSAINQRPSCVESLMTPRGEILTVPLVLTVWFLVGSSIRRLARRRWRARVKGRLARALLLVGLVPLPVGLLGLLFSFLALFFEIGLSARLAGIAFWTLYLVGLSVERLRIWPFELLEAWTQRVFPTGND